MEFQDKDLGKIMLVKNNRAKRITARYRNGQYCITYPSFVSPSSVEKAIEEMKPQLLKLKERSPEKLIFSTETEFSTYSFDVKIIRSDLANYYSRLKEGILHISCPRHIEFEDEDTQTTIRHYIEKTLRSEAKRILPEMVRVQAAKHEFMYTDVRINKSRSRWGSCSSKKSINLSYYCLLLPAHLLELIILHELCHTKEMNHSEKFWALLDKVTNGYAKQLTKELKLYKTNI